jgi:uncharacterized membrane protein (UPF0182 family)
VARIVLDRWWYDSVTDAEVWSTRVTAQLQLGITAGIATALVLGACVAAVFALDGTVDDRQSQFVRRYRQRMGPAHHWLLIGIVIVSSIRVGATAASRWQAWLLYRHGGDLGTPVPNVGGDLGDYLFELPFRSAVSNWTRLVLVLAIGLSVFGHFASGALRSRRKMHSTPPATTHVALLLVLLAAAQAAHYALVQRPSLAVSSFGSFDGAGFTDIEVLRPALLVMAVVAVAAGAATAWSSRTQRWRSARWAWGTWLSVHVALLAVVPLLVDKVVVAPAQADRQLPYIAANLTATRRAFDLDRITVTKLAVGDGVDRPLTVSETSVLDRTPLFDASLLPAAIQVLQGTTGTRVNEVDIDRYPSSSGSPEPVFVSVRAPDLGSLPESGWVQAHLVYTHGDGVVSIPADTTDADGRPGAELLAGDASSGAHVPVYFGDGWPGWYVIVGTDRVEQGGEEFAAHTGIRLGSGWRRLIASIALGEAQPVLSSELTDRSQLLMRRDIGERLQALAPFLAIDGDPYPVVTDGRVTWIADAYTTADTYPYSQHITPSGLPVRSGLAGLRLNYVHASVKVTVDAVDGTTTLYRTAAPGDDPVLDAWDRILPGLMVPIGDLPDDLRAHLLYPNDVFTVQSDMLGRYHVTDPELLFNGTDRWRVSTGAPASVGETTIAPARPTSAFAVVPGTDVAEWASIRPYSPGAAGNAASSRDELTALVIAEHDTGRIELVELEPPTGQQLPSPQVAQSAIDADPELARLLTLLNANGSKVQWGPMTPLLVGGGLVWVRTVIVTGTSGSAAPRLFSVLAVSNGLVGQGPDVAGAVAAAIDASSQPIP